MSLVGRGICVVGWVLGIRNRKFTPLAFTRIIMELNSTNAKLRMKVIRSLYNKGTWFAFVTPFKVYTPKQGTFKLLNKKKNKKNIRVVYNL